jgi:hypothetical protein
MEQAVCMFDWRESRTISARPDQPAEPTHRWEALLAVGVLGVAAVAGGVVLVSSTLTLGRAALAALAGGIGVGMCIFGFLGAWCVRSARAHGLTLVSVVAWLIGIGSAVALYVYASLQVNNMGR